MKINGTYLTDYVDFSNTKCVARIEKGMLYIDSESKVKQPKDRHRFIFKRTDSDPRIVFSDSHFIEYYNESMARIFILINPNKYQSFRLKWITNQLILQKITSLEYAIGLLLAFVVNIVSTCTYDGVKRCIQHHHKNGNGNMDTESLFPNSIVFPKPKTESKNESLNLSHFDSLKNDGSLENTSYTVNPSNLDSLNLDTTINL